MTNPCLDVVQKELAAADVPYRVDMNGKHVHIRYGKDYEHLHVVAKTPSDYRAPLNERAQIRRDLVRLGFISPDDAMPDCALVTIREGQPSVASYHIAEHFSKAHKDVLRAIDRVRDECGAEFDQRNFAPIEYVDSKGRKYRAYSLTRDGFSLVVMGFTGAAATRWKVRYIEAFNALESEVRSLTSRHDDGALRAELDAVVALLGDLEVKVAQQPRVRKAPFIRPSVLRRMRRAAV